MKKIIFFVEKIYAIINMYFIKFILLIALYISENLCLQTEQSISTKHVRKYKICTSIYFVHIYVLFENQYQYFYTERYIILFIILNYNIINYMKIIFLFPNIF